MIQANESLPFDDIEAYFSENTLKNPINLAFALNGLLTISPEHSEYSLIRGADTKNISLQNLLKYIVLVTILQAKTGRQNYQILVKKERILIIKCLLENWTQVANKQQLLSLHRAINDQLIMRVHGNKRYHKYALLYYDELEVNTYYIVWPFITWSTEENAQQLVKRVNYISTNLELITHLPCELLNAPVIHFLNTASDFMTNITMEWIKNIKYYNSNIMQDRAKAHISTRFLLLATTPLDRKRYDLDELLQDSATHVDSISMPLVYNYVGIFIRYMELLCEEPRKYMNNNEANIKLISAYYTYVCPLVSQMKITDKDYLHDGLDMLEKNVDQFIFLELLNGELETQRYMWKMNDTHKMLTHFDIGTVCILYSILPIFAYLYMDIHLVSCVDRQSVIIERRTGVMLNEPAVQKQLSACLLHSKFSIYKCWKQHSTTICKDVTFFAYSTIRDGSKWDRDPVTMTNSASNNHLRYCNMYNLYRGLPWDLEQCNKLANSAELQQAVNVWFQHLYYVIANGNEQFYNFICSLFSHKLKHPHFHYESVIVIAGEQRIGKTELLKHYAELFGNYANVYEHVHTHGRTGHFDHNIAHKLFLVWDEWMIPATRTEENEFKNFMTKPAFKINIKYQPVVDMANQLLICATIDSNVLTNHCRITKNGSYMLNDRRRILLQRCRAPSQYVTDLTIKLGSAYKQHHWNYLQVLYYRLLNYKGHTLEAPKHLQTNAASELSVAAYLKPVVMFMRDYTLDLLNDSSASSLDICNQIAQNRWDALFNDDSEILFDASNDVIDSESDDSYMDTSDCSSTELSFESSETPSIEELANYGHKIKLAKLFMQYRTWADTVFLSYGIMDEYQLLYAILNTFGNLFKMVNDTLYFTNLEALRRLYQERYPAIWYTYEKNSKSAALRDDADDMMYESYDDEIVSVDDNYYYYSDTEEW